MKRPLPNCICFCHTDKYKSVKSFKEETHWAKELLRVLKEDMKIISDDNKVLRQQITIQDNTAMKENLRKIL